MARERERKPRGGRDARGAELKSKPADFRVREILADGYLAERGPYAVYRVTKRKLTTLEAAEALADATGVPAASVGVAGLKDRQGITVQYMSVPGGREAFVSSPLLAIQRVGFASEPLTSACSAGNAFDVVARKIAPRALPRLVRAQAEVEAHGLPNYFGEQRFGNLVHGQGWIARDLMLGHHERALKQLLCAVSPRDDVRRSRLKESLAASWGDWRACRETAGRLGAHHSIFDHLARNARDFAGAFRYVGARVRLIHLYAYQSHVWNRAVARSIERRTPRGRRVVLPGPEGPFVFWRGPMDLESTLGTAFRLPGPGLEDVAHPEQRALLAEVLEREGLDARRFRIEGVPGFQLKGEDRELILRPRGWNVSVVEDERSRRGSARVRMRFVLPRGAYAMLVVRRLLAELHGEGEPRRPVAHRRRSGS